MEVILFFGSFNPIHIGHMILAQTAINQTDASELWLVVSPQNPHKSSSGLLHENQRLFLAQLASNSNPKIKVSNIEFGMPKPSYTIDTLAYLEQKYPNYKFSILMGGDNIVTIHKWKNFTQILENHTIYVYSRPNINSDIAKNYQNVQFLDAPLLELSSTQVRQLIKSKKSIKYLVPEEVETEIIKSGYYL